MDILFQAFVLIFSLFLLIKGADYFVEGSANLALNFGVSPLFIGLTLVAFGTSAPEAAVSIHASLKGANDISIGNVIGSNIANIGLVLGVTALLRPVFVSISTLKREIPMVLLSTLLLALLMFVFIPHADGRPILSRVEGGLLLIFFILFIYYTLTMARKDRLQTQNNTLVLEEIKKEENAQKNILMVVGGILAIGIGGKLFVDSSIEIARYLNVSERFIAVTLVAIGTSLPELATSVVAVVKKEHGIALGNIVGSCIFNILFVLGMAASIHPVLVDPAFYMDLLISFILAILLLLFAIRRKTPDPAESNIVNRIDKWEGFVFLFIYIAYMGFVIVRL